MAASSTSVLSAPPRLEALIPHSISGVDIRRLPLRPEEAFVWSRVDGHTSIRELCFTTGLPLEGVLSALQRLIALGALAPVPGLDPLPSNDPIASAPAAPAPVAAVPMPGGSLGERVQALERAFTGNHYELLGVPRAATRAQVKEAYFGRVAQVHPDRFFGQELGEHKSTLEQLFQKLTVAHDTLTRSKLKTAYDATLPPTPSVIPPADIQPLPSPLAASAATSLRNEWTSDRDVNSDVSGTSSTGSAEPPETGTAPLRASLIPPDVTLRPRRQAVKGPPPGLPSISQTLPAQATSPISVIPRAITQGAPTARIPAAEALRMASSLLSERPPPPNNGHAVSAPPSSGSSADLLRAAREASARGDYAAALQHYSKVTGVGSNAQLLREAAQCARAAKKPQRAVELLRQAIQSDPNSSELLCLLGEVYAGAGMLSSAKSSFQRGLDLKPNDDNCKLWLKRIERGDVH